MITYSTVQEIYANNFCSERLYKRKDCPNLVYTDGVMDFAEELNAHWVIENVISYMPFVLKTFNETEDTFFVVEIGVKQDKTGYMEVFHEGYVGNDYHDHLSVIYQKIPFIDLPVKVDEEVTTYKFYLSLHNYNPIQFMLLLPSEY